MAGVRRCRAVVDWHALVWRQDLKDMYSATFGASAVTWKYHRFRNNARSMSFCNEPDKTGYVFEDVLIKAGGTRIWGDFA